MILCLKQIELVLEIYAYWPRLKKIWSPDGCCKTIIWFYYAICLQEIKVDSAWWIGFWKELVSMTQTNVKYSADLPYLDRDDFLGFIMINKSIYYHLKIQVFNNSTISTEMRSVCYCEICKIAFGCLMTWNIFIWIKCYWQLYFIVLDIFLRQLFPW